MRKPLIVVLIVVLMVLYTSMFVVQEGQRGIVMRFGKVLRDNENKPLVYAPGLHFKIPFLESVKSLMRVSRPWITRPIASSPKRRKI